MYHHLRNQISLVLYCFTDLVLHKLDSLSIRSNARSIPVAQDAVAHHDIAHW